MKTPFLVFFLLSVLVSSAAAADLTWSKPTYSTKVDQLPARDLLRAFAVQQGLPADISDRAATPISGEFQNVPTGQFLDAVCAASELLWFWDGTRLHIDPVNETESRMLNVTAVTPEQANTVLHSLGFESGPVAHRTTVRGVAGVLALSGSKRFLELTEPVLKAYDELQVAHLAEARENAAREAELNHILEGQLEVRVFRLTYASAADITLRGGNGSQSSIPGVARALQTLMGSNPGTNPSAATSSGRKRQLTSLRGSGLAGTAGTAAASAATPPKSPSRGDSQEEENHVIIQADSRLNAVIVRDTAGRMPEYEALIKKLDTPSLVIEISAAVVDIDSNNSKSFGTQFLGAGSGSSSLLPRIGSGADPSFNQTGNGSTGSATFVDGPNLVRGPGINASALLTLSGFQLLSRIQALEDKGEAQLVTNPSILTLDNTEANLSQQDTVYVRVAGSGTGASSDLYNIHTGVQLRVTPTLIREGDEISFRLLIDVQDGSFNASELTVDSIPGTRESSITTQAVVPANKTLLIGGYFVDKRQNATRQVPGLGSLPIVGALFKTTDKASSRAQRFYFLTPRLVDVTQEAHLSRRPAPGSAAPLSAAVTDSSQVLQRARELVGTSLLTTPSTAPAATKP